MSACVFCEIVAGRSPATVLHEDERVVAFLDIFPLTAGHALVIPRRHCENLLDATPDEVAAVATMAQRLAQVAVDPDGLAADGVNLLHATGAAALQTVFHLHVHVLPRYVDDGFVLPITRVPIEAGAAEKAAAGYRAALGR